ncbi:polynucleotide kinase-phosphatase [Tsukamurella sp. PLM1]|uniref:polynucleotide kinase-phosphatase n=1 Tax=Tsukamurella sp. PLM1 TaxID=2929795 RepID=UPI00205189F7|nr:polynucleotide kinase-phosphatase [Tsukamurella sp. PLM1]BDH55431.1 polynucleotide kinase-phosphatase [Tsukamurella sp. PLM1]
MSTDTVVTVPMRGLILLAGASGSGKSTFARKHFRPTEVVSSDVCRGLVADDENDQAATSDAFDLLHHLVGIRLRRGLLTVVDATNVQRSSRASLVALARAHDVLVDVIVFDLPDEVAIERNRRRADRTFGPQVITRQARELRRSLKGIKKEGFRRVHMLRDTAQVDGASILRERPWNDRTELAGPFDVIGDVHGCASELRTLLTDLGWRVRADGADHPEGRTAVFVGDLVDRGPDTPGVLRLVMGMVAAGNALCVSGNHENKLVRALKGNRVTVAHGLQESLDQLAAEPEEFRSAALAFMDSLLSHYVLDGGRLVVAHAGLKEEYHGRASRRVRAFALYGDTTGETDEIGLPVRYPWARDYRGAAAVVYGHTPVTEPQWINNTLCIDTGAVFGGALTALRYPECEIVSVPAESEWYAPAPGAERAGRESQDRPVVEAPSDDRAASVLRYDDVAGTRWLSTRTAGRVKVEGDNAAAALEVMSRFAVDPRWLVYLPPTMSPASVAREDGFLEHPSRAFEDFAGWGVERVICEEKHMGSRAVAVIARDSATAARRFGVADGGTGAVYTRTGRAFFDDVEPLVDRLRRAVAPLFDRLETDWLALDCELLPWSAKAGELIRSQYASVGAAREAFPAALAGLDGAAARGLDVAALRDRTARRALNTKAFRDAYARYYRPTDGLDGVTVAPFQVLAAEGRVLAEESHEWHMAVLGALDDPFLTPTRHCTVDLASEADRAAATRRWTELTDAGGEGMVVKPLGVVGRKVQPGLKVRGREYLRIIYGPDYLDSLDVLRDRNLGRKRKMALAEHALGRDALAAFVAGEPLWRVHQSVFAVLAQESEPVDPRL